MSPAPTKRRHNSAAARRQYLFYSNSFRLFKPSRLESIRFSAYALVFIWSLVALAIAVHFDSIFQSSDLTRFIPYAVFTSAISLVAVLFIVATILIHSYNSIAIKTEISILGLVGVFWLVLGLLMATSPAEEAEVECFFDAEDTEPTAGFATETYRAQYRVLVAAGCINATLLLGSCLFMAFLTVRHWRKTKDWVEFTGQPLLDEKPSRRHNQSRSSSRGAPPLTALPARAASKQIRPTKESTKGLPPPVIAARKASDRRVYRMDGSIPALVPTSKEPIKPPELQSRNTKLPTVGTRSSPPKGTRPANKDARTTTEQRTRHHANNSSAPIRRAQQ